MMKIAIYSRIIQESDLEAVQQLFDCIFKYKLEPVIHHDYFELLKEKIKFRKTPESFRTYRDIKDKAECMLSIGGDGTLLDTVALVRN
jgi:NAD+ kinase